MKSRVRLTRRRFFAHNAHGLVAAVLTLLCCVTNSPAR